MQSIVYQDRCGGKKFIFENKEMKRSERIASALEDLKRTANINIYLYKHGKLRLISQHEF